MAPHNIGPLILIFSEIERVCEEADFEIDLSTGQSWNKDPSIFPQYVLTQGIFIRPPANPEEGNNCNLSVVMRINMAKYSAGKLNQVSPVQ